MGGKSAFAADDVDGGPAARFFIDGLESGRFDGSEPFVDGAVDVVARCCPWAVERWSDIARLEGTLRTAFPDARHRTRVSMDGGALYVRRTTRATHGAPFLSLAPTGRTVTFSVCYRVGFRAGRIAMVEVKTDLRRIVRQLCSRRA